MVSLVGASGLNLIRDNEGDLDFVFWGFVGGGERLDLFRFVFSNTIKRAVILFSPSGRFQSCCFLFCFFIFILHFRLTYLGRCLRQLSFSHDSDCLAPIFLKKKKRQRKKLEKVLMIRIPHSVTNPSGGWRWSGARKINQEFFFFFKHSAHVSGGKLKLRSRSCGRSGWTRRARFTAAASGGFNSINPPPCHTFNAN